MAGTAGPGRSGLIRGTLVLLLLAVPGAHDIGLVDVLVALEASVSLLFATQRSTLLPRLVPQTELQAANGLMRAGVGAAALAGPALGAVLLTRFGFASTIGVDAATYGLSALLLTAVAAPRFSPTSPPIARGAIGVTRFWPNIRWGVAYIAHTGWLQWAAGALVLALMADGALSVGVVAFVIRSLHQSQVAYGIMKSVAAGASFGGVALMGARGRWFPLKQTLVVGLLMAGVSYAVLFQWGSGVAGATVCCAAAILGGQWFGTSLATLIQSGLEPEARGRVFGAVASIQSAALVAGILLMSAVDEGRGFVTALLAASALLIVAAGAMGRAAATLLSHTASEDSGGSAQVGGSA